MGLLENCHWLGKDACLVNADWSNNAAGIMFNELLGNEWHTQISAITNEQGMNSLTHQGYFGRYLVTSGGKKGSFELKPGLSEYTVTIN